MARRVSNFVTWPVKHASTDTVDNVKRVLIFTKDPFGTKNTVVKRAYAQEESWSDS